MFHVIRVVDNSTFYSFFRSFGYIKRFRNNSDTYITFLLILCIKTTFYNNISISNNYSDEILVNMFEIGFFDLLNVFFDSSIIAHAHKIIVHCISS